jgi:hypothetical protein
MDLFEEYRKIEAQIIAKEEKLLSTAPDDIKKLYLEIDYLINKQTLLTENMLINN